MAFKKSICWKVCVSLFPWDLVSCLEIKLKVLTDAICINCILLKTNKDKMTTQTGENKKLHFIVLIQLTENSIGRTIWKSMTT